MRWLHPMPLNMPFGRRGLVLRKGQHDREKYVRAGEVFCVGNAVRVVGFTEDGNMSFWGVVGKKIITCNDEDE